MFGDISYRLPDVWIAGATWRLRPGLELTAMVRWLWLHVHDRIDIRLSGPTLDRTAATCPSTSCCTAGSRTSGTRACASRTGGASGSASGRCCASRPARSTTDAVNAAAVDGFKLQPVALIEFRILRQLWLGGGYGVTFMRTVDVTDSVFKPELATECVDRAGGNLADRRLPGAAGGPRAPDRRRDTTRRRRRISASRMTLKF